MKEKRFDLFSLIATALILVLTVLQNACPDIYIFAALNAVISPFAMIAALVCAYLAFNKNITLSGKWVWGVIALTFALALKNFAQVTSLIFAPEFAALEFVAHLLYTAGYACVFVALLNNSIHKILPISFCVLAVAALIAIFSGETVVVSAIAEILLYAALAEITYIPTYESNNLVRRAAVVLAVVSLPATGLLATVCWIILAFVLVPAHKFCFSFRKLTAILCVLIAIFGAVTFFISDPMQAIEFRNEQIDSTAEQIDYSQERITSLQTAINDYKTVLETTKTNLETENAALTDAQAVLTSEKTALQSAENALDAVCYRSYYSSLSCSDDCRPLHQTVSDCKSTVNDKEDLVKQHEDNISRLQTSIAQLENNIKNAEDEIVTLQQRIDSLKQQLCELRNKLIVDWFILLIAFAALAVSVAALAYLGICLYLQKDSKHVLVCLAALALGAFVFAVLGTVRGYLWAFSPLLYILTCPYIWSIAICAFLAAVVAQRGGKPVKFRIFAIIAAIVLTAAALVSSASVSIIFAVFAVVMICVSFVLVPAVFTEYNSIGKHIFLTLITAGIWQLIWTFHVTKNLNKVASTASRKPALELLLCLFLPLYYTYWLLKTAENVEAYGNENGKQYKLDIVCLVFAFICPLISTVLIQNKINQIVGKPQ